MNDQTFLSRGEKVDRKALERALDFFVELEPEPVAFANDCERRGVDNGEEYKRLLRSAAPSIAAADAVIRKFGEQQVSLAAMQAIFREMTGLEKYEDNHDAKSIISSKLSRGWRGLHGWQH